jgi:hypothetical protein
MIFQDQKRVNVAGGKGYSETELSTQPEPEA